MSYSDRVARLSCEENGKYDGGLPVRSASITYRAPRASLTLADFDIIRRIGDGSFSEVMHVRDKRTGINYALKMVDKHLIVRHKMVDHIKQERNILDQCDYPGIARLYFTFQDEASLYLGLELCHNGELYDQIRTAKRLAMQRAVFYAAEVVLMLDYLRTQHVVHRDLKPENLLLTTSGHLKLVDFGSAMLLDQNGKEPPRADGQRHTSLVGTADYVAPEVLSNEPVTHALDLWALGCIIYQMLVGKAPFKAASEYLTFQLIADASYSFPANPALPPAAEDIIRKLLVVDSGARLGAEDLQEVKDHPFFEGINWQGLRDGPAPDFARPQQEPDVDSVGLDWEMSSLAAALPVAYQAHEGAPMQYTSGAGTQPQHQGSPGTRGRRSGLGMRTYSVNSADSHRRSITAASSPSGSPAVGPAGAGAIVDDDQDNDLYDTQPAQAEESFSRHSWSAHSGSSPTKRVTSVRRLGPFISDAERGADVEIAASRVA